MPQMSQRKAADDNTMSEYIRETHKGGTWAKRIRGAAKKGKLATRITRTRMAHHKQQATPSRRPPFPKPDAYGFY